MTWAQEDALVRAQKESSLPNELGGHLPKDATEEQVMQVMQVAHHLHLPHVHRSRHQFTKNLHRSATASIMTCFFVNSSKKSNIVTVPLGAPMIPMLRRTRGIVDV